MAAIPHTVRYNTQYYNEQLHLSKYKNDRDRFNAKYILFQNYI
jgi:hypothetical protein